MRVGELVGGRFELAAEAGSGGMGTIFRALDRQGGGEVAVKVLGRPGSDAEARFEHEARVLSGLDHPHIVRYVMHGLTPAGEPYLAMEWLDGESLEMRLSRRRLTVQDSVDLARCLAGALAAAHARGVVHRDIKPGNVFLAGGSLQCVKLLDFGIARLLTTTNALTRPGGIVGTPGYMAPEQARGEMGSVGAAADVFSLGAVLFECLTGKPAFQGAHIVALLAKVLWEEAPRVRELAPDVPLALDRLVARMLSKDPADRPQDGAAVLSALERLGDPDAVVPPSIYRANGTITEAEKRLVSVVAVSYSSRLQTPSSSTTLPTVGGVRRAPAELRRAVAPFGMRVEELANGMFVALLVGAGKPTDQAALAARSALRLRSLLPEAHMVLLTGWGEEAGRLPVGDALERAASLLERATAAVLPEEEHYRPIHIDDVTRALLDVRFDVMEEQGYLLLRGERDIGESVRTLLGRPSPFLGRDRELRSLMELIEESFEERLSRAVLVTAEAGMGKSRLRHELVQRIGNTRPRIVIGVGRSDAIGAGSPFATLASAFRGSLGIAAGEAPAVRWSKLASVVDSVMPEAERLRIKELLGEMIDAPSLGEPSPRLRAARQNPSIMADQIQAAFLDFIRPLSQSRPILLLLEDLHWGDSPSVKLIDIALRELAQLPFAVVAFARPEVHDLFPRLWAGRDFQEIRLTALPARAAADLARRALGPRADPSDIDHVVERAGGNAFYLEELIRAVANGRRDGLPETVLGMVEARLSELDPAVRRALRAASVFGDTFWKGGVLALLEDGASPPSRDCFAELAAQELICAHGQSRLSAEREYAFRHTLIREAAYAMLADRDRASGHRRAAEWLERAGEADPMVLAEHFERGREPGRAAEHYLRAAEQAHRAGDNDSAMERARRGLEGGAPPDLELRLLGLLAELYIWRNDWGTAAAHADKIFRAAAPGSAPWVRAATARFVHAMNQGEIDAALRTLDAIDAASLAGDALDPAALGLALGVVFLVNKGRAELAEVALHRLHALVEPLQAIHPIARAWMHLGHPRYEAWINEDPFAALRHSEAALVSFREAHYTRGERLSEVFVGMSAWMLGSLSEAERALRQAADAEQEFALVASLRSLLLVFVLAGAGCVDDAKAEASRALEAANGLPDRGRARWAKAEALRCEGRLDEAEEEAFCGEVALQGLPMDQAAATVTLSVIQLQAGRPEAALETVRRALSRHDELGAAGYLGALARLTLAECLWAAADRTAAKRAIAGARLRIQRTADKIIDPARRASFLKDVPENRRTLELAADWLGH